MLGHKLLKNRVVYLGLLTIMLLLSGCSESSEIDCEENYDHERGIKTYCLEIVAILDEPLSVITFGDWTVYACPLDEECQGLIYTEGFGYGIDATFGIHTEDLADIEIYTGAIVFITEDITVIHQAPRPGPITIIDWELVEVSDVRE